MSSRIHIFAKKLMCVFLCALLAFTTPIPSAYAEDRDQGASSGRTDVANPSADTGSNDRDTDANAISEDDPAQKSTDDDTNANSGEDVDPGTPDNPGEQIDPPLPPAPEPPVPAGPITYNFNIKSRPYIQSIEQVSSGLRVTWSPVSNVDGYIVLRRKEGTGLNVDEKYERGLSKDSITLDPSLFKKSALKKVGWMSYAITSSSKTVSWLDKNASYGQMYEYVVMAYKKNVATSNAYIGLPYTPSYAKNRDLSKPSPIEIGYKMRSPSITALDRKSKTLTVKWDQVSGADGYIVECSKNSAFSGKTTKRIKGKSKTSVTFKGLSKSAKYCVRIRAYGNVFFGTSYSPWNTSSFTNSMKRASMSRLMYKYKEKKKIKADKKSNASVKGKSTKNLKAAKKVKYITKTKPFELRVRAGQKMGKYDTMQGGCSDGKYMYFCLLNKSKKRCKIAKVRISTKRVVKVSKPLKLNHGNGMAYNPDTKRLIVAHGQGNRRALSEISKTSLKLIRTNIVNAPSSLKGATPSQLKAYKGFGSVAYSSKEDVYVCLLYGSHNVVLLDSNFRMIEYITLSKKKGQIYQCIEVVGDNILIGESFGSTYSKRYNILSTYNWDGKYVTTTRLQKSFELENVFVAGTKVYAGFYRSYVKKKKFMRDNYVYRVNTF